MQHEEQEKIDLYLEGKLKGKPLQQFEEEMSNDKAFKRRVDITKDVNERFDDALFAKKLSEIAQPLNDKYIDNQANNNPLFQYKWILIGLLGLSIIGSLIWFSSKSGTNVSNTKQEIFAMYYEPYAPSFTDRSTSIEETQQTILQYYKEEKYQAAIPLIEPLFEDESVNDEWKIESGNCYLDTENSTSAIKLFDEVANSEVYFSRDLGQWYLALAHLKNEDKAVAKPILEKLANKSSGKYSKLAKELLSKL